MLTNLTNDWNTISSALNYPVNFSEEDQTRYQNAKKCYICNSKFNKSDHKKTKHHYHYIKENNYAGTLCISCNLKLRTPHFLPVVVHSLSYDLSLILKELDGDRVDVNVNKKNKIRFYSTSVGKSKFIVVLPI